MEDGRIIINKIEQFTRICNSITTEQELNCFSQLTKKLHHSSFAKSWLTPPFSGSPGNTVERPMFALATLNEMNATEGCVGHGRSELGAIFPYYAELPLAFSWEWPERLARMADCAL